MDASDVWPWVQALHLIGTIILGGIIWAFQAGAKARAHDLPPQPAQDSTTRTAALVNLIRNECESLEQRSPKATLATLHVLEGKLKELQTEIREKHAYWRQQYEDQQDALNAALRTVVRLEERQENIGKRLDEAWGQIDRRRTGATEGDQMSDTAMIALFAALPNVLLGLAILVAVIKGNGSISHLKEIVNGKFSEMLKLVADTSETKGKVDTIEKAMVAEPPQTTVILDRRKGGDSDAA